jgi:hypothetical protein
METGPKTEYTQRLEARRQQVQQTARLFAHVTKMRIVTFVLITLAGWLQVNDPTARWLLIFPSALFIGLVMWHARVSQACRRAARAAGYYERRLAYLDQRWAGSGSQGTRYVDENHSYALDLDLFGKGSLFELLCAARTRNGEDALAGWLLAPSAPEQIRERQEALRELTPRLDLREDLALLGADVPVGIDLDGLAAWGNARVNVNLRSFPLVAMGLVTYTILAFLAYLGLEIGLAPFVLGLLLEGGFALWLRSSVRSILGEVEKRAADLMLFAGVLARLERETFHSAYLRRLQQSLQAQGQPPSSRIAQLSKLIDWLNSHHNLFFAPLSAVLLCTTQLAFAVEAWRRRSGAAIGRWLAAVGEFEALCSLAGYAYENPLDPFPEVTTTGPCFDAVDVAHPLLPRGDCVPNSVRLDEELRLLLISGSNMSGKSTFLRTVGINTVLALMGAPVRAERLRVSPLAVGATLRIQDSLQEGRSRFYTELTRVRQLLELARGKPPLLFLLDELFQGTNSHDRRLGAEAVVRTLVESGGIGLVTTHDLALTQIADLLAPRAQNVHFEDHFENGVMTFDYRMQPGVVRHSNALALMRSVGIEV